MTHAAAPQPLKVLFVCRYNRHRSATAERVFCKDPRLDVRSAGTSTEALARVNDRMLAWADIIFVMEEEQRVAIENAFPGDPALERMVCLHIPDVYTFLDPRLVTLLEERTAPHLERLRAHDPRPKPKA